MSVMWIHGMVSQKRGIRIDKSLLRRLKVTCGSANCGYLLLMTKTGDNSKKVYFCTKGESFSIIDPNEECKEFENELTTQSNRYSCKGIQ